MKYNLPMPSLGADMYEGKILEWKVKVGDRVVKNQTVAEIETTKAVLDVESFKEGIVLDLVGPIGEIVQVGKTIAVLEIPEEKVAVRQEPRVKISPAAKKLADDNKIDLMSIPGAGEDRVITLKDVEDIIKTKSQRDHFFTGVNLRQAIASMMTKSKKEIPHYYLKKKIQLNNLFNNLDERNKLLSPEKRLLVPAMLAKAVLGALKKYPEMNAFFKDNQLQMSNVINLGIAFSIKSGGVIVPAVLNAETMCAADLSTAIQNLAVKVKSGGLTSRELSEGTITITNVGDLGSDEVFGIIFPPQVALIGIGHIRKEPLVDLHNQVSVGYVVDVSLSADHRASDGLLGSRFLSEIDKNLNNPSLLE